MAQRKIFDIKETAINTNDSSISVKEESNDKKIDIIFEEYFDESREIVSYEKNDIVETIASMLNFQELKIEVLETTSGAVDKELTKLAQERLNKMSFIETFISAFKLGLLKGYSLIRVSGTLLNPKIYLATSSSVSLDRNELNHFQILNTTINLNFGSLSNIATETYDYISKKFYTTYQYQNKMISKYEILEPDQLPYIFIAPNRDVSNNLQSIFYNTIANEKLLDEAYRKLYAYLEYYNFYYVAKEEALRNYGGAEGIKKILKSVIVNNKDADLDEILSLIDPSQQNIITLIDVMNKLTKLFQEKVSIQSPVFENANQKSEYEIRIQKLKEENFLNRMAKYTAEKVEDIVNILLPIGYKAKVLIDKYKISNDKEEAETEKLRAEAQQINSGGLETNEKL